MKWRKRKRKFSSRLSLSRIARSCVAILAFLVGASRAPQLVAFGQQVQRPSFEVASIKLNNSGSTSSDLGLPAGDLFTATNVYVQRLIRFAYNVQDFQIASGAPGWTQSDRFDISARIGASGATRDEFRLMLQALLADRFQLRIHHETRQETVFELTVDSKSKLTPAKCVPDSTAPNACEIRVRTDTGTGSLSARSISMQEFASTLQSITGNTVLNRTGLTGSYDMDLKWSPGLTTDDIPGPSLFTVLKEETGLRLRATKGPVDMLVIDHVERPSEN